MSLFKFKEPLDKNSKDSDFMPDIFAAEAIQESRISIMLFTAIFIAVTFILIWISISEVDEITRGSGKVIPSSKIQIVDHLEGGIIKKIHVLEGQIVQKDQLLIEVEDTAAEARFNKEQLLYYRYLLSSYRLKAQINNKKFVVPKEILENAPLETKDAIRMYKDSLSMLQNDLAISEQTVKQQKQTLKESMNKTNELNSQIELINDKIKQIIPLVEQQLEPKITLTDLKINRSNKKIELETTISESEKIKLAIKQAEQQSEQITIKFKNVLWEEFKINNKLLEQTKSNLTADKDTFQRTNVRSPVKGIIKQLLISTEGGVIQPGDDLVEIVPLDDKLLVEAMINPKDVAFLRPGLKASIKVTAYDYSIYGDLKGEIIRISADSITEKDKTFYKVFLRTNSNLLSKYKKKLPIMPGMVASVDIITGKKTILTYLLKPLIKSTSIALTER